MSSYSETFTSKLDWAMPFQRTGTFPLDRSSIFSSYSDALNYAKQDGTDSRKLGGTSYIGQIIAVYGNGSDGTTQEVAAYIITAVGTSAALMKLAQTSSTGDFSKDIAKLQADLAALATRVATLEGLKDKFLANDNSTYEVTTGTSTNGAISITEKVLDKDGVTTSTKTYEAQVKGWAELEALASGRSKAYVYKNTSDSAFITAKGTKSYYKVGDIIYFSDKNIADLWVGSVSDTLSDGSYYTFYELESTKCDLTGYLKTTDADAKYATKETVATKAAQSDLNTLQATVTANKTASETKDNELETSINELKDDLDNLDVSSQITAKINDLDVAKVGGATGSYISSIEQIDGKISAVANTLPDYDSSAQEKADKALEDAKKYTDDEIGEIGETTVKGYVDTAIENANTTITSEITKVSSRVTVLETNDKDKETRLSSAESTIAEHTTKIADVASRVSTVEGKVSTLESKMTSVESKLNGIESGAQVNKIEVIKVGGVAQTITDKTVNITEISTDLLKQGSNPIILDCQNASLTTTE